ncbi:conjugative transposon protein TraK [Belliella sp. DSM 111904]|uniref:Conjugative transposon protein TraK n=1 Tax=Belliella filtrata TaxID=2923435 RepID=A0ABS9V210_9BACT|nr:conjugative transposon protein TraK [Belliella filtrata]MCH7410003.1 conjugative transposon protein TraK [Belliella filtrata]
MFRQLKNIDTAFQHIKTFTIMVVVGSSLLCCFTVYQAFNMVLTAQERIYLLANDKALEAFSAERKDNIPVEARDHVKMFHHYFFTLDPDEKVIESNINKALGLADNSAANQFSDLKEAGYYTGIISGSVSQTIYMDSAVIDTSIYPFSFRYHGTQKVIRSTSVVTRKLITEGRLRNVNRSDLNPHGFLIERWKVIENRDIDINKR